MQYTIGKVFSRPFELYIKAPKFLEFELDNQKKKV